MSDRDKLNSALTALDNMRVLMDLAFDLLLHLNRDGLSEEAMSDVSKTESLCLASRAYADSAIADGSRREPTIKSRPDPLASLIADYRRLLDQHNALKPADLPTDTEEEAHAAATWRPLYERLEGDCPTPTSLAGVREALRLALNREMGDHMPALAGSLLQASLAYLEGAR